ncbi:MAG: hypothetical protein DLM59_01815 [Pseudonocardiales bacterium]|nr:MAG: hypothetical protein DLM59_01815 [Pseudonocardiales bacterium]
MSHIKHSYLMIGLLVAGAALSFTGIVNGKILFLLGPAACMAMMFFMLRGTMGMQGGGNDHKHETNHDDVAQPVKMRAGFRDR